MEAGKMYSIKLFLSIKCSCNKQLAATYNIDRDRKLIITNAQCNSVNMLLYYKVLMTNYLLQCMDIMKTMLTTFKDKFFATSIHSNHADIIIYQFITQLIHSMDVPCSHKKASKHNHVVCSSIYNSSLL